MEIIETKLTNLLPPGNDLLEYFARQHHKEGKLSGRKEGRKEGKQEGILLGVERTAINCILAGYKNEAIKLICNLTDEQINEIRKKLVSN